jgi:hypothetical protein
MVFHDKIKNEFDKQGFWDKLFNYSKDMLGNHSISDVYFKHSYLWDCNYKQRCLFLSKLCSWILVSRCSLSHLIRNHRNNLRLLLLINLPVFLLLSELENFNYQRWRVIKGWGCVVKICKGLIRVRRRGGNTFD